jgi:hypothetical protein
VPSEHGKGDRAQKVGQGGRVRTGKAQWTALDPMTEQASRRQELTEENKLTQRRHRRGRIPLHMDAPTMGVHRQGFLRLHLTVTGRFKTSHLWAVQNQPV